MKISTKGRYAIRVMLDIAAQQSDRFIPLKDVSIRQEISEKYLEQIISTLNRAGYLKSLRGSSGGHRLAKGPETITVGEILRAAEGSLAPVACLDDEINQCPRKDDCLALPLWEGLNRVIQDYVDHITLADLLAGRIHGENRK